MNAPDPGTPEDTPAAFADGECAPPRGCGCMCHQPGGMAVKHFAPCCDEPPGTPEDQAVRLARIICVCTGNHSPETRIECRYARTAAERTVAAGWRPSIHADHQIALLRAVESFVDANGVDLPLNLLDSIRAEIGDPR